MQHKTKVWLLAAALGFGSTPAFAQLFDNMNYVDPNTGEVIKRDSPVQPTQQAQQTQAAPSSPAAKSDFDLAGYIDGTKTLAGDFEQIVFSGNGQEQSKGTFQLKRPGMFDWNYQEPSAQRIISNGQKVYHYDEDLEQITIRPRSELSGDVAMNLLVGNKKLNQEFKVKQEAEANAPTLLRTGEAGLSFYQLMPKGNNDDIDHIWLVMYEGAIAAVYVDTGVGQKSLIVLRNLRRNQNIANNAFDFTPPPGVDVIGG